jgi:hypothetical protein
MSFDSLLPWIIALAVIYVPTITYIGFELWRAPLVDENGNVISDGKKRPEHHPRRRASLTPAE